ncbi:MAG: lamin tail domain-containing protein [Candidatus Sumerlaeaceae bacterium]|nr:lamin tail domain-containing protein [Candidatus Sumerlaeaceae bacterium]
MVLALLALLVLIAAAFSISVRMELVASQNYSQSVAAVSATRAALGESLGYLETATSLTHLLQPWAQARIVTKNGQRVVSGTKTKLRADEPIPRPYDLTIKDTCARLNVNAVRDAQIFARFLRAIMPKEMADGVAETRAVALLQWRGAFDESATTACLDLRFPRLGGFRRVEHLEQLLASSENPNLFRPDELAKLAPYVTVFSVASESQNTGSTPFQEKLPLDSSLTAEKAYVALRTAFPDKEDRLLRQYATNLADLLDGDDVPTRMKDPSHIEPWNDLLGLEQVPFITEIYPDSVTRGSDEGQFVEIYNPWDEPVSLEGWRIIVGGTGRDAPGQAMIPLSGKIAPGGFVVVTDCYDVPPPNTEPGTGAFLAIFGRRADNIRHRIIANAALELPDKNSFVSLVDGRGNLIDIFSYTTTPHENSRESYQRPDPSVRAFLVADATPFELYAPDKTKEARECLARTSKLWREIRHGNRVGLGHLLLVPTSYVGLKKSGTATRMEPHFAQAPLGNTVSNVGLNKAPENYPTNLDLRLLDVFASSGCVRGNGAFPESSVLHSYGKVNVNTCLPEVLWGLDGSAGTTELISESFIQQFASFRVSRYQVGQPPFPALSDFARLVLQNQPMDPTVASALSKLLDQVCVGSLSFEVAASSLPSKSGGKSSQGPSTKANWILGLDFRPCSIIHFAENLW